MFSESETFLKIAADFWKSAVSLRPLARAFQFVTFDGSFNILKNCSILQFVTVRSSKEFRGVSIALSARTRVNHASVNSI